MDDLQVSIFHKYVKFSNDIARLIVDDAYSGGSLTACVTACVTRVTQRVVRLLWWIRFELGIVRECVCWRI